MKKKFNTTGVCLKEIHYMMDSSAKIRQIIQLIESGAYFTINRPRQYGKTTTLETLLNTLDTKESYLGISIDFAGIDDINGLSNKQFSRLFLQKLARFFRYSNPDFYNFLKTNTKELEDMDDLSDIITEFIHKVNKRVILFIDEVDASSNYISFLSFLAMLRSKYLKRHRRGQATFHSIILAGVHDVKDLKYKLRGDQDSAQYNSPWNIATNFEVEMSFQPNEIAPMLEEYSEAEQVAMNTTEISEKLYYYTSGYPLLISALCKIVAEDILPNKIEKTWTTKDIENAAKQLIRKANSVNFESLVKNLENNKGLYDLVFNILIKDGSYSYNPDNPVISLGILYGIFRNGQGLRIHNRIYEQRIYNYMISNLETDLQFRNRPRAKYVKATGELDIELLLTKFQEFMQKAHDKKDKKFLERDGRLVFLAFMAPILNGHGFAFKEPQIADAKRLDVAITYHDNQYIIELKRWYGDAAHVEGLEQLIGYLEREQLSEGFMLIFEYNKKKSWRKKWVEIDDKRIFSVWV